MRYWWVNQKKTFDASFQGGFLWSPKKKKGGYSSPFYDHMTQVQPGDMVFAFANKRIKALAVVTDPHHSQDRPDAFDVPDSEWGKDGWAVPVTYRLLEAPLLVSAHMDRLDPHLPDKYSPLKRNGKANEAYLCPVPQRMADELLALMKVDVDEVSQWREDVPINRAIEKIENDRELSPTQKKQLITARLGQGKFRNNVKAIELRCRVTGTSDVNFLIASHIKPWADSDNAERLDGNNGLMLAPHVDRLFDRGFISFEDEGGLIVSPKLPATLLQDWSLEQRQAQQPFNAAQRRYLDYHRNRRFQR